VPIIYWYQLSFYITFFTTIPYLYVSWRDDKVRELSIIIRLMSNGIFSLLV